MLALKRKTNQPRGSLGDEFFGVPEFSKRVSKHVRGVENLGFSNGFPIGFLNQIE